MGNLSENHEGNNAKTLSAQIYCPDCDIKMKKKYDKTTYIFGNVREFFCEKCRCWFISYDYSSPQPMCVE